MHIRATYKGYSAMIRPGFRPDRGDPTSSRLSLATLSICPDSRIAMRGVGGS